MRPPRIAPLLVVALACASAPLEVAGGGIDWEAVATERTPEIVTLNADGSEKVRKLWFVVVDGTGYIRTGQSSWFANIQRDANVVLRLDGVAYPLRAVPVVDRTLRDRVGQGFREKYGIQDFLIHPFRAPGANIMALVER